MVLIYDAYHETVQNERAGRQRIDNLEQDIAELKEILKHPEMIAQITNLDSRLSLMLVLLVPKLKELLL
jgi:cell division septum initiation protein DivIVA